MDHWSKYATVWKPPARAGDGGAADRQDEDHCRGGPEPGPHQATVTSSARTVPCAYQPWTNTVTLVVEAPVVNRTLSWVKPADDGLKVWPSLVPVPLTPM